MHRTLLSNDTFLMDHLIMIYEFNFSFMLGVTYMAASFENTDHQLEVNNVGCKNKVEMCGMEDNLSRKKKVSERSKRCLG